MKKLALLALLVLSIVGPASAQQVTDHLECSQFWDTVTISGVNGNRVDIVLSGGLYSGCVATPEASVDGASWVTVPIKKNNSGPNVYALTSSNTAITWNWTFRNATTTDYNLFRLRISAFGGPGGRLVTLTIVQ
jgi:hypothetical protein